MAMTTSETAGVSHVDALPAPEKPVVFFDGVCGFCNFWVDFTIHRDPHMRLLFAPLQGETARQLLPEDETRDFQSVVLWTKEGRYKKSAAVVRMCWRLGGLWSWVGSLLWMVPRPVRDWGYGVVAQNRYRLAGRKETCRLPTVEERARFLP